MAFLYQQKHQSSRNPQSSRSKPPSASKPQNKPLGKPPLGPGVIIPANLQAMVIKPQISQSAGKMTNTNIINEEEKPINYQVIQPRNPELRSFAIRNDEEKKEELVLRQEPIEKCKILPPKPEVLSKPPTYNNNINNNNTEGVLYKPPISHITNKPATLGNFRHFNQIAELSDLKPSHLPYLSSIENEEKTKVEMNLNNKFNTEAAQSPEKSEFSSIWFNPKPNLNKFSEHPGKGIANSEIIETNKDKEQKKKVNLHSILKNSSRHMKNSSENKSTSIDNNNFEIPPVKSSTKTRLYSWLISIDLLKENLKNIIEKLPKICRNGVIYADIINRLEPRGETLKGISRKPKKTAEIHANFQKIFDFFSKLEKMNKRFLYHFQPFMDGNEGIFWGFLDDIWHFYHLKISSADMRFQERFNSKRTSLNESYNKRFFNSSKKSEFSNASYDEICQENHTSTKFVKTPQEKPEKTVPNTQFSSKNNRESRENYETRAWTLPQKNEEPSEVHKKMDNSRENSKKHAESSFLKPEVLEWLKFLGFSSYFPRFSSQNPCENPLKNGLILSQILSRLHLAKLPFNKSPQTIPECERNLDLIFQALRKLPVTLPPEFTRKIPEIIHSDESLVFEILAQLKSYSEKSSRKSLCTNTSRLSVKSLTNSPLQRSLSHNESSRFFFKINNDIENLECRLFNWLKEKGLLIENNFEDFSDLFPTISNGVLLCDLAEKLCGGGLIGVTRKALTEKSKRTNIQKAIDLLKEGRILSVQGWSLANDEIYKGNYMFIMEILEALYQYDSEKPNNFLSNREAKVAEVKEEVKKNSELIEKTGILKGRFGGTGNKSQNFENNGKAIENTAKSIRFKQDETIKGSAEKNVDSAEKKVLDAWFKKLAFPGIIHSLDFSQKFWPEFKDG